MIPVGIEVRQIILTPQAGTVEVDYVVVLENQVFQGAIGGGKTSLVSQDVSQQATALSDVVESRILQDLGLVKKVDDDEEPLDALEEEEDLL